MAEPARPLGARLLLCSVMVIGLAACARTGWRLHESVELTRQSKPMQRSLAQPSLRLLIVGDSTAVGTGATAPEASLAGLLADHFPRLQIVNRASDGAKFAGLLFRESADDPFVLRPELNAADGLHPSDAGYRVWFSELMAQADLSRRLSAALASDR